MDLETISSSQTASEVEKHEVPKEQEVPEVPEFPIQNQPVSVSALWARYLERECQERLSVSGNNIPLGEHVKVFTAEVAPRINITQYLERFEGYADMSAEEYVLAAHYMRMCGIVEPQLQCSTRNAHRLILVACLLAKKWHHDQHSGCLNGWFSRIGGVPLSELNGLEYTMYFQILNTQLDVTPDEFALQCQLLGAPKSC